MRRHSIAPLFGIASCLVAIALFAVPYAVVPPLGTQTYYNVGPVGPPTAAVLALGATAAFVAARTDAVGPPVGAGTALAFTTATLVVSALWWLAVDPELVMELARLDALAYHRHLLVAAAAAAFVSAAWFAAGVFLGGEPPARAQASD